MSNEQTILNPKTDWVFKLMFSKYLYVELNELIVYTMKKRLEEYSLKDFWIRFLANYEEYKKSGMLEELCKLEEGIKMAEATLFRVTDEERRMAIELSDEKYRMYVEDERSEARREGLAEGRSAGLAEGRAEGSYQAKVETAKNLIEIGLSIENIVKTTGLSREEIEKIK